MNTIQSTIPLYDASQNQPSLTRSLHNLAGRARPAPQAADGDAAVDAGSQDAEARDVRATVALQNQFAALADPAEAAAVNQTAATAIASSPDTATAVQAGQDAGAVRQLVSGE